MIKKWFRRISKVLRSTFHNFCYSCVVAPPFYKWQTYEKQLHPLSNALIPLFHNWPSPTGLQKLQTHMHSYPPSLCVYESWIICSSLWLLSSDPTGLKLTHAQRWLRFLPTLLSPITWWLQWTRARQRLVKTPSLNSHAEMRCGNWSPPGGRRWMIVASHVV